MSMPSGDRKLTIAEALREGIAEEMRRDPDVFLIGEDIGIPGGFGGAFGVYLGLPEEFGHERIIDTPDQREGHRRARRSGAALMGMRPIADMQYADFLFECMDELVNQAAKMRYMSGGKLRVPMVMARRWVRPTAARSMANARRASSCMCLDSRWCACPTLTTPRV